MAILSLSLLFVVVVAVSGGGHLDLGHDDHVGLHPLVDFHGDHHLDMHNDHHGGYKKIDWCKNGKRYAIDHKDCSRYIQRFGGLLYSMPCAPGTHWSQRKCTCSPGDCKRPNYVIRPPSYGAKHLNVLHPDLHDLHKPIHHDISSDITD